MNLLHIRHYDIRIDGSSIHDQLRQYDQKSYYWHHTDQIQISCMFSIDYFPIAELRQILQHMRLFYWFQFRLLHIHNHHHPIYLH